MQLIRSVIMLAILFDVAVVGFAYYVIDGKYRFKARQRRRR